MLVDGCCDTSWTRGQYPAAPPDRLDIDPRWPIIFLSLKLIRSQLSILAGNENNHLRVVVVFKKWSFTCAVYFWPLTSCV